VDDPTTVDARARQVQVRATAAIIARENILRLCRVLTLLAGLPLHHPITTARGRRVVDLDDFAIDARTANAIVLRTRLGIVIDLAVLVRLRDPVPAVADDFLAIPRAIIRGVAVAIIANLSILDHAVATLASLDLATHVHRVFGVVCVVTRG
jgi:hypothetical protein